MTTPANKADSQEKATSFADLVNQTVNTAKVDEKGNLVLPDDLSEEVKYAATLEKRRRDTQSSYTKEVQSKKALEVEKATLLKKIGTATVEFTPEQKAELEDLKFSDPDEWRKKLNEYETTARTARLNEIDVELKQVSKTTLDTQELEERKTTLANFQEANPELVINDDVIASDIPPRIMKELETGKITFEAFLDKCATYLKTGKVVKQDDVLDQPNLGKVGGGNEPDKNAKTKDSVLSYANETY